MQRSRRAFNFYKALSAQQLIAVSVLHSLSTSFSACLSSRYSAFVTAGKLQSKHRTGQDIHLKYCLDH